METRLSCVLGVSLLVATGCAPGGDVDTAEDSASDDAALTSASITFDASWNENLSGALVEGGVVSIAYDDTRLAECRAWQGSTPQFAVTAHARLPDGSSKSVVVAGLMADANPSLSLPSAGDVEIWFEATNKWGCHAWDSNYGDNYRFHVLEEASKPDWIGNGVSVLSRSTCDGGPCDADRRSLDQGVSYDTWARQRAAVRSLFFDVWEPGVTDFDNSDLWKQLDAEVHFRWSGESTFQSQYVDFSRRNGHDARYELPLAAFDPFGGSSCPASKLTLSQDGSYVETTLELYFTVNGKELRPSGGGAYHVVFADYRQPYEGCL